MKVFFKVFHNKEIISLALLTEVGDLFYAENVVPNEDCRDYYLSDMQVFCRRFKNSIEMPEEYRLKNQIPVINETMTQDSNWNVFGTLNYIGESLAKWINMIYNKYEKFLSPWGIRCHEEFTLLKRLIDKIDGVVCIDCYCHDLVTLYELNNLCYLSDRNEYYNSNSYWPDECVKQVRKTYYSLMNMKPKTIADLRSIQYLEECSVYANSFIDCEDNSENFDYINDYLRYKKEGIETNNKRFDAYGNEIDNNTGIVKVYDDNWKYINSAFIVNFSSRKDYEPYCNLRYWDENYPNNDHCPGLYDQKVVKYTPEEYNYYRWGRQELICNGIDMNKVFKVKGR